MSKIIKWMPFGILYGTVLGLLSILVATTFVQSEDDISISTGIIGNGKLLGAKTIDGNTTVGVLGVDSNGNTTVRSLSGKTVDFPGDISLSGSSSGIRFPATVVLTPAVTPLSTPSSTNQLNAPVTMMATAAPTSAFVALPQATANAGKRKALWNSGANPTQIMPASGDTINALGAATPYACATGKWCECKTITNALSQCTSQ